MRDLGFALNDKDFSDRLLHLQFVQDTLDSDFGSDDSQNPNKKQKTVASTNTVNAACEGSSNGSTAAGVKTLHIISAVLASCSPFFYNLFKNGMKESQDRNVTLVIHPSEERAFMDLLNFMYTNKLSATSAPDLLGVLMLAVKYEVGSCMSYCSKLLEKIPMSLESALLYVEIPSSLSVGEVIQSQINEAKRFVLRSYIDIFHDSEEEEECNEVEDLVESDVEEEDEEEGEDEGDEENLEEEDFVNEDYSDYFRTRLTWDTKEELYQWAKDVAKGLNIVLIKLSTNPYRISMGCERFGGGHPVSANPERRSKSKKCLCPFELVGVRTKKDMSLPQKLAIKHQRWILYIIEGRHNHKPSKSLAEGNVTYVKQVANFLQKLEYEDRGELTVTQWSMRFLANSGYVIYPLRNDANNEIEILFFAYKESLELLKKFPYVVVIDATYKSNKYDMPLVEIVGFTCTDLTFTVGFAFTRAEKTCHYTYIMRKLRACYERIGLMPTAIMTVCELALIKGIKAAFGSEVQHLLCWVHIRQNIKAHAYPILKSTDKVEAFASQCWTIFSSRNEATYEERLARLRKSWRSGLVGYVEREWLTPYKESIVRAWTENRLHFNTTTSNRDGDMRKRVKEIIGSSRGGFNRVIVRIHHSLIKQLDKIRASMNRAATKRPRDWDDASTLPWIRDLFSPLFCKVSDRCIDLIVEMYNNVINHEFTEECEDPWVRTCFGLPCAHEIARAIINRKPITLDDVHDFWKQLDWQDLSSTQDQSSSGKGLADRRLREMWSKFESGTSKQSTAEQLTDLYIELEYPKQSTYADPSAGEKVKRKRKPLGAKNKNMVDARDKSLFEHRKKDAQTYEKEKAKEKKTEQQNESRGNRKGRPKKKDSATPVEVIWSEELQSQPPVQYHHSQESSRRIFHLGLDFGIGNIDEFWIPYICLAQDVCDDGHCGYKSLAVLLGRHEGDYISVRRELVTELIEYRELYDPMRQGLHEGTWEELIMQVSHCVSPCSANYWLQMPFIGLVFATLYQVRLVLLTWHSPSLCLPLRSRIGNGAPPTTTLAMAHVGERNHFIPIALRSGSPLPQTPGAWRVFSDHDIRCWEDDYNEALESYRTFRRLCGRRPDPWM